MTEETLFEQESVKITNARFIVDGQTYAIRNLTSIKPVTEQPSRFTPILLIVVGLALTFVTPFIGLPVLLIAVYFLASQRMMHHIFLCTSAGEQKAFTTQSVSFFDDIVEALNNAIARRG